MNFLRITYYMFKITWVDKQLDGSLKLYIEILRYRRQLELEYEERLKNYSDGEHPLFLKAMIKEVSQWQQDEIDYIRPLMNKRRKYIEALKG